jgi:hypothetical protein
MLPALTGCSEECNPCKSGTCPDVSGIFTGTIQTTPGTCEEDLGSGPLSLDVSQTLVNPGEDDEFTRVTILIGWAGPGLWDLPLTGELCDTNDGTFIGEERYKRYPFSVTGRVTRMGTTYDIGAGGHFLVYEDSNTEVDWCGGLSITTTTDEASCTSTAAFFSSENMCDY